MAVLTDAEINARLRERYGFSYTPEFILFDPSGQEVWRSHTPPSLTEVESLASAGGAA